MLSGTFPFNGKTDKAIYKSILKRKFEYPDKIWKTISNEAKDLINHMLCDEGKRYSAEKILKHPWLTKLSPSLKHTISQSNIVELKNYKNNNNFKRFILTQIKTAL